MMNHEKITKALGIYDDIVNGRKDRSSKKDRDEVNSFVSSYPEFKDDDAFLHGCLVGFMEYVCSHKKLTHSKITN